MRDDPEPRPVWVPEALFPFESRRVEVLGARLHYVDEGRGPPLLLLHGNPTWSFLYRDIVKRLRSRFRCIAPDYPGFGLSGAPAGYGFTPAEHAEVIERFVLELRLSEVTLMVHDWGGPVGLGVAGRHPERFRALVIGNSWAWPVSGNSRFEWFSWLAGGALGRFLILDLNAFVGALLPAAIHRRPLSREALAAYRGPFGRRAARLPTYVFPREITRSRAYLEEVERGLARLRHLPALILWGERDIAFGTRERARFEGLFPSHETVVLKDAGHFIQEDAAEEVAAAITRWWGRRVAGAK